MKGCKDACASGGGGKCHVACGEGICGPRCREIKRRTTRCGCGKVSCRLYGIGCGSRHGKASWFGSGCGKLSCADGALNCVSLSECSPEEIMKCIKISDCATSGQRACGQKKIMKRISISDCGHGGQKACGPNRQKASCATKVKKRVKASSCGSDCKKACCATKVKKRVKASSCGSDCKKACCADKIKKHVEFSKAGTGCQENVFVVSATDGGNTWVQDGVDVHKDAKAIFIGAGAHDDQDRKVKKIRIKTSGPDGEKVVIEEIDAEDDVSVWQSDDNGGAWLGVYLQDLTSDLRDAFGLPEGLEGALIADVVRSGPARKAGIREGFVVVRYDDNPVRSADDLVELVRTSEPGDRAELVLNRKGHEVVRRVTLGKKPQERVVVRGQPHIERFYRDDDDHDIHIEIPDFEIDIPEIHLEDLEHLGEELRMLGLDDGAYLGVGIEDDDEGVLVTEVYDDTPADDYGIEEGDLIFEVDGDEVEDAGDLVDVIRLREPGDTVVLYIERDGDPMKVKVELGENESRGALKMIAPRTMKLDREKLRMDRKRLVRRHETEKEHAAQLKMAIKELEKELKRLKKKMQELEDE
jgi:C-terminal processing protease CtpA/Prc